MTEFGLINSMEIFSRRHFLDRDSIFERAKTRVPIESLLRPRGYKKGRSESPQSDVLLLDPRLEKGSVVWEKNLRPRRRVARSMVRFWADDEASKGSGIRIDFLAVWKEIAC